MGKFPPTPRPSSSRGEGEERRLHAQPRIRQFAREMRKGASCVERILWEKLRGGRLKGLKFRRQCPVGMFVADVFCAACKVVVEADGESHEGQEAYDAKRTGWLEGRGYCVVRVRNEDVLGNLEGVLKEIARVCERRSGREA